MRKKTSYLKKILLGIILIISVFLFSCTQPPREDRKIETNNGLIIEGVNYVNKIQENSELKIDVILKNSGLESKNIVVKLYGLSDRWNPRPVISISKAYIASDQKENITFNVKSPDVEINTTYNFDISVEYDYISKYVALLKFIKNENNISVQLESENLVKPAPINIKLNSYFVNAKENQIFLNFTLENFGDGKVVKDGNVKLKPNKIVCTKSEIKLINKSTEVECKIDISRFEQYTTIEIYLEAYYRYFYQTKEPYKVEVYNIIK